MPPEQDAHYTDYINHLLTNRFISDQDIIDFGGLDKVPADEFISATLWHIYKSLNSPYKSLLKLFLMEAYASEYPDTGWLANQIKRSVYVGNMDFDALDPYFLIYQKVENYLRLVRSQKRLALARECFYLKIMGSAPNLLPAAAKCQPTCRIFCNNLRNEFY
ncbi:class I adenylate cyclase [methane-oxidizing endosymbiont of Gigantopelta aegis]|uniref:class I adenylate cyclase n=1 Tax=methane-oxidizing endosymbiont of Gigantopelta aegis TaxID=2794938 RepID=UPI003159FCAD